MLGVHAQELLEEPEVMTLRRNELRNAAYYVQLYTINMEYWRSRLGYLERAYWEAANAWGDPVSYTHLRAHETSAHL
eukprot:12790485-Alexandrium_andersonii.AAC.1